jgi:transketolase
MKNPAYITTGRERLSREFFPNKDYAVRRGILKLLAIKDSDIRLLTLEKCRDTVDKGLHAGGAFSSVIPLVALFTAASFSWTSANFLLTSEEKGGLWKSS